MAAQQIRALLQQTHQKLVNTKPRPPVTAHDLLKASLLREYKIQETTSNVSQIATVVQQAWTGLRPDERAPFEARAAEDKRRFDEEQRQFENMQADYTRLKELALAQGVAPPEEDSSQQQQQPAPAPQQPPVAQQPRHAPQQQGPTAAEQVQAVQRQLAELHERYRRDIATTAATAAHLPPVLQRTYLQQREQALQRQLQQQTQALQGQLTQALGSMGVVRQVLQQAAAAAQSAQQNQQAQAQQAAAHAAATALVQAVAQAAAQQGAGLQRPPRREAPRQPAPKPVAPRSSVKEEEPQWDDDETPRAPPGVPATIEVSCQNMTGTMHVMGQTVTCHCPVCVRKGPAGRLFTCPQWEIHAGAVNAKKWKTSLRVRPGGGPGVPLGSNGMQVLKWLEMMGVNYSRPPGGRAPINYSKQAHEQEQEQQQQGRPPLPEKTYTSERIARRLERQQQHEQQLAEEEERQARRAGAKAASRAAAAAHQLGARAPGRPPKGTVVRADPARPGQHWVASPVGAAGKPWRAAEAGNYEPILARFSGERCCVCDLDQDFDFDQMVACDRCGITVHQSCYGIMELPGPDEMYLCRACELHKERQPPPQCCVCPVAGGALKQTTVRGLWCHSACLQWIPELTVNDVEAQEPINGVQAIPKERWELLCTVCRQRMGAKIQCEDCFTAYHPLCARIAGYVMEIRDSPEEPDAPVQYISWCARHAKSQPHLSSVRLVSESEQQGDLPERRQPGHLWNAQPYALPSRAPLPVCPAGAARAMPILAWQRQQHGTGTGASSTSAWWIPGAPSGHADHLPRKRQRAAGRVGGHMPLAAAAAAAEAAAAAAAADEGDACEEGGLASPAAGNQGTPPHGAPSPRPHPGGGRERWGGRGRFGGRGRGAGRGGGRGSGASSDAEEAPPECAELMPLPEGVPDSVAVWCNEHTATFLLRPQRFLYNGEEMSGSAFEAAAGMGHAKKWKSSVYAVTDGEPDETMQEWLDECGLDRRALEVLSHNVMAVEAWQEYQAERGADHAEGAEDDDDGGVPAATGPATTAGGTHGSPAGTTFALGEAEEQSGAAPAAPGGADAAESPPAVVGAAAVPNGGLLPLNGKASRGGKAAEAHVAVKPEPRGDEPSSPQQQEQVGAASAQNGHLPPQQGGEQPADSDVDSKPAAKAAAAAAAAVHTAGQLAPANGRAKPLAQLAPLQAAAGAALAAAAAAASGGAVPAQASLKRAASTSSLLGRKRSASEGPGGSEASGRGGKAQRLGSLASGDLDTEDSGIFAGASQQGTPPPGGSGAGGEELEVDVVCGELRARFDARCVMVTLPSGQRITPIELEHASGKGNARKWKWSIRVDAGGGEPGVTLEDWLAERGLEDVAAPRASPATLETIARRPPPACRHASGGRRDSQGRFVAATPATAATAATDAAAAGEGPGDAAAQVRRATQEAEEAEQTEGMRTRGGGGAAAGRPRFRDGKRAYLQALPQLATAGVQRSALQEVPLSRCWTPQGWASHRQRQVARAAALQRGDGAALRAADLPPVVAGAGVVHVDSLAPQVSLGPSVAAGRMQTVKDKLDACNATEPARIAFGKSGVHGWGLFARMPMEQDSMVAEYRGVLVRAVVAEAREGRYRAAGRDCYLFNLDDELVLDSTEAGAISRFTNHSCSPSMYTKILNVDGRQRLVFFARHNIEVGQELTYNYRFEREEGEERLPCACGAPACSGFLN